MPYLVSIEVEDYLGVVASHNVFTNVADPTATTVQNIIDFLLDYANVLDPMTDAKINSCKMTVSFSPQGHIGFTGKTAPAATAEVERGGLFNWSQTGSIYKEGALIPAIADSLVVNGKIDLTKAAYTAWKAFLLATTDTVDFVSKYGNTLLTILDVLLTFRKRRKLENHRSFEVPTS